MKQDRETVEKGKRSSKYIVTSYEAKESKMIDRAQDVAEKKTPPEEMEENVPPGEFEKIMSTMRIRGIETTVYKELRTRELKLRYQRIVKKPVVIGLLVILLIGGTSMGVSATKAYDFRMRERDPGKNDVVWNNDQEVLLEDDSLEKAYDNIQDTIGIQPIRIRSIPFDMKFQDAVIENGISILEFKNDTNMRVYFQQSKKTNTASKNVVSDRDKYCVVYNQWLDINISIGKHELENGNIEYTAAFSVDGSTCSIEGVLEEEDFINMVKKLSY